MHGMMVVMLILSKTETTSASASDKPVRLITASGSIGKSKLIGVSGVIMYCSRVAATM